MRATLIFTFFQICGQLMVHGQSLLHYIGLGSELIKSLKFDKISVTSANYRYNSEFSKIKDNMVF